MKAIDHSAQPGSPGGAFRPGGGHNAARTAILAVYAFAALIFCSPVLLAQDPQIVVRDANGAFYSVSSRYNNRNEYLHISKMSWNGKILWAADYDTGSDEKPVAMVANPMGLVILAATGTGNARSYSLIYYSFDNFLVREVAGNTPSAVPMAVTSDKQSNIYVAYTTKRATRASAELSKYDANGTFYWNAIYEPLTNAYAQEVQILYNGDVSLGVTQLRSNAYGEYEPLALIYNTNGGRLR